MEYWSCHGAGILPEEVKKQINDINVSSANGLKIPLDMERVITVFYKKQDYEPYGVPMGYPVLEDIDAKSELKKMDMAIAVYIGELMYDKIL